MRQPHVLVATAARRSVATAASPSPPPPPATQAALLGAVRSAAGPLYDRALADAGPDTGSVFDSGKVNDLATSLGHSFGHRWLLRAAFVHRSFDAETYRTRSADLLAWLGDASMYQGATMALVAGCPAAAIGSLTDARKALISRAACARAGRDIGIHTLLATGGSFAASDSGAGGATDSMVAEAFESMVGAVAVDGGHDAAVRAFWRVQPLVSRMQDLFVEGQEAGQQAPASGVAPGASASAAPPPNTDLAALRAAVRSAAGPLYDRVLADAGPDTASVFDAERLTKLETALGHPFREPWLLRAALMHRSFDAETYRSRSSELLAWIGDASMYQGATTALLARFPTAALGELSVARAALISRADCARTGRELGIDTLLQAGASFASTNTNVGGATDAMVAEAFEAVLGAIAADGGHDAALAAYFRGIPVASMMEELFSGREEAPQPPLAAVAVPTQCGLAPGATTLAAPSSHANLDTLRAAVRAAAGPLYDVFLADDGPDTATVLNTAKINTLATALGRQFQHIWLMHAALMHGSYCTEVYRSRTPDLLAWIGDSSMYQAATTAVLPRHPDAALGALSNGHDAAASAFWRLHLAGVEGGG